MALVTLKCYDGTDVDINPAMVQAISTYQHLDNDMALPDEFYIINRGGDKELDQGKRDEADRRRTSTRVIVSYGNTSAIVKGTVAEIRKALA